MAIFHDNSIELSNVIEAVGEDVLVFSDLYNKMVPRGFKFGYEFHTKTTKTLVIEQYSTNTLSATRSSKKSVICNVYIMDTYVGRLEFVGHEKNIYFRIGDTRYKVRSNYTTAERVTDIFVKAICNRSFIAYLFRMAYRKNQYTPDCYLAHVPAEVLKKIIQLMPLVPPVQSESGVWAGFNRR
jgi:hypothetical protein